MYSIFYFFFRSAPLHFTVTALTSCMFGKKTFWPTSTDGLVNASGSLRFHPGLVTLKGCDRPTICDIWWWSIDCWKIPTIEEVNMFPSKNSRQYSMTKHRKKKGLIINNTGLSICGFFNHVGWWRVIRFIQSLNKDDEQQVTTNNEHEWSLIQRIGFREHLQETSKNWRNNAFLQCPLQPIHELLAIHHD